MINYFWLFSIFFLPIFFLFFFFFFIGNFIVKDIIPKIHFCLFLVYLLFRQLIFFILWIIARTCAAIFMLLFTLYNFYVINIKTIKHLWVVYLTPYILVIIIKFLHFFVNLYLLFRLFCMISFLISIINDLPLKFLFWLFSFSFLFCHIVLNFFFF